MSRSGGSREVMRRTGVMRSTGALVARNPLAIGGVTAFFVAFSFVAANALWYQPHAHPGALFATRKLESTPGVQPEPIRLPAEADRAGQPAPAETGRQEPRKTEPAGDPTVFAVQSTLSELRLYDGPVDGLNGPQTREAVQQYQRVVGLEQNGTIDAELLRHLGIRTETAREADAAEIRTASLASDEMAGDPVVWRVQAGLRAFGNSHIQLDGIAGKQTEAAVREFQALFGLEETGRPDEAVLARMRELGLVD